MVIYISLLNIITLNPKTKDKLNLATKLVVI